MPTLASLKGLKGFFFFFLVGGQESLYSLIVLKDGLTSNTSGLALVVVVVFFYLYIYMFGCG